ncbi:MAG TPA: right-handed parallel beta-helix repeat-containing protein, partial [Verrucomicrobiota bacterium]|nr:right-handed parallel beta-helix repeat-containing protein [Verrucomicrobiota bacterium]
KQLQASKAEEHLSFVFERNIVYYKTGKLLDGPWDKVKFIMASNCFYNIVGAEIKFAGKTLQQWQEMGKDKGSIIADPLFVDGEHYDFRLKRGSPVFKLGFKPFDYSKAGVYGDKDWIKRTKINYPPLEIVPPPAD